MNGQPPDDSKELLNFIAATMEAVRERMVTKDDIRVLREQMTTKDDIEALRERTATKDDIEALRERMATKEDLETLREQMATKDDLFQVESRLGADIARLEVKLEAEAARLEDKIEVKTTIIRGDIEQVRVHLGVIDNTLSTRLDQMGADISRLRSALYLLAKDQPDVLRLLGREPLS